MIAFQKKFFYVPAYFLVSENQCSKTLIFGAHLMSFLSTDLSVLKGTDYCRLCKRYRNLMLEFFTVHTLPTSKALGRTRPLPRMDLRVQELSDLPIGNNLIMLDLPIISLV